jgi:hypothetical protein
MDNKVARLIGVENQIEIKRDSQGEFLFQYQKAVLLTLSEQGIISEPQYRQCIDKLTEQALKIESAPFTAFIK